LKLPSSFQIHSVDLPIVCYMHLSQHEHGHFYIVIPLDCGEYITASIVTSKVEKVLQFHSRRDDGPHGLVLLERSALSCLTVRSVVNCHETIMFSKKELVELVGDSFEQKKVLQEPGEKEIIEKVLKAILASEVVIPAIKERIQEYMDSRS
jgi:hypothetical protein